MNTQLLDTSIKSEFGYGAYFSFSPIPYYISKYEKTNQNKLFLGALIEQNTNCAKIVHYCELQIDSNKIIHKIQMATGNEYIYEINSMNYEGQWFMYYIKFSTITQIGSIQITDILKQNNQIFHISNTISITQQKYIIQYTGTFNLKSQIFSYFPGLYYQIKQENDYTITEEILFNDKSQAKYTCSTDYNAKNIEMKLLNAPLKAYSVNQGCSDYAIETWIKVIKIPLLLQWETELVQISHNQFADYYNHVGGNAFKLKYIYQNQKFIINIQTYSYQYPTLDMTIEQIQEQTIQYNFQNLSLDILKWHYFKFKKISTATIFEMYFPFNDQTLYHDFGKLYQFTRPKFTYYLSHNVQNDLIIDMQISNFTLYNKYIDTIFQPNCYIFCKTCNGPTSKDCTSCQEKSNRILKYNQCVCQLGYIEIYLTNCSYPSNLYMNVSSINLNIVKKGYESIVPYIKCQFGYFKYDNQCIKCPQPINSHMIGCLYCVIGNDRFFYSGFSCSISMFKKGNTFIQDRVPTMVYTLFIDELILITNGDTCTITTTGSKACEYSIYSTNSTLGLRCNTLYYVLKDGVCMPIKLPLYTNKECGQFCEDCDQETKYCLRCIDSSKFFISSDSINCELCTIENCEYCNLEDMNDPKFQIYTLDFTPKNRQIDTLRVVCAKCKDGFYFNYKSYICEQGNMITNCDLYFKDSNEIPICILSKELINSYTISDCKNYIPHCLICNINQFTQEALCLVCETYYYFFTSNQNECILCKNELNCESIDSSRQDLWKAVISPYFYNKFSIQSQLYQRQTYQSYYNDTLNQCLQFDFYNQLCLECPRDDYATQQQSLNNYQCFQCPYLCSTCQIKAYDQTKFLNPMYDFVAKSYICFLSDPEIKNVYINSIGIPLLCDNEYPCQLIAIQERTFNCFNFQRLFIARSAISFESYIDKQYIYTRGISLLKYIWTLNFPIECQVIYTITSNLQIYVPNLNETQLILKGQLNQNNLITSAFTIKDFNYIQMQNFVFHQFQNNSIHLQHQFNVEIYLENLVFENYFGNSSINCLNAERLIISNITFNNITFLGDGQSIISLNFDQQKSIKIEIDLFTLNDCYFYNSSLIKIIQNNELSVKRLQIYNCIFDTVILFDLQQVSTLFELNEVTINNIQTNNFNFIKDNSENKAKLTNFNIQDSIFQNQSFIFNSIILQLSYFKIENNQFINSSFYSIHNNKIENIEFNNLIFLNNTLEEDQSLISIISKANVSFFDFQIQQFICQDDTKYQQSAISIKAIKIEISNFDITLANEKLRKLFYLYKTQWVIMSQLTIKSNHSITQLICTTYECFSQNDTQTSFQFENIATIQITNIQIENLILINNPLFTFEIIGHIITQLYEICIENIIIKNVLLLKSQQDIQISLIFIKSTQQKLNIGFTNLTFTSIWMHQYIADNLQSATLFSVSAPSSSLNFTNSQLNNILTTNTTNSIITIDANIINFQNLIGQNLNYFDYSIFKQFLKLNFKILNLYIEDIEHIFRVKSQGGLSHSYADQITIKNVIITKSRSGQGGVFYFTTKSDGIVLIQDCQFIDSQADLQSQISKGGFLYLDSSSSLLNLEMQNIVTKLTMSQSRGGLIYILASPTTTSIKMNKLQIQNTFSRKGSLLFIQFSYDSQAQIIVDELIMLEEDLDIFLQQLQVLNDKDITELMKFNHIFDIEQCTTFIVKNSKFFNFKYINYLNLQDTLNLFLQSIIIESIQTTRNSFIQLINKSISKTKIYIFDLKIQNSNYITYINIKQSNFDCQTYIPQILQQFCLIQTINPNHIIRYQDQYQQDIYLCNIQQIHSYIENQEFSSFINIIVQNSFDQSSLRFRSGNLYFYNISNSINHQGLFLISTNQNKLNNFQIFDSYFLNNYCGKYGCLAFIPDNLQNTLESISTNLTQDKPNLLLKSNSIMVSTINNVYFINNKASYGSGLFTLINQNIIQSIFSNNQAQIVGGGIYMKNDNIQISLIETFFIDNQAQQGSDIFLKGQVDNYPFTQLNYHYQNDRNQQSLSLQPVQLGLKVLNGQLLNNIRKYYNQSIQDYVQFEPYLIYGQSDYQKHLLFPSGQQISQFTYFDTLTQNYLPYNLNLEIIAYNEELEQIINLDESQCQLQFQYSDLMEQFQHLFNVTFDNNSKSYNLNNFSFILDPLQYSYKSQNYLIIKIICDSISQQNYELIFTMQSFECQMGEYYFESQCLVCNPLYSYYSLDPLKGKCDIQNDQTTISIQSAMVQLKQYYWRPIVKSDQIVYCINKPQNCQGGWNVGDQSCSQGYLGALCEECDSWNLYGFGNFGKTVDFTCDQCSNFYLVYIKSILLLIWIYIQIYIIYLSVSKSNEKLKLEQTFQQKLYKVLHSFNIDRTSIILKMLTNFIQIVATISSFHIQINLNFDLAFGIIGNPTKQITTLLDCELSNWCDSELIYCKLILLGLMVIIIIILGIVSYLLIILIFKIKYNSSYIYVLFIFIAIYTHSSFIYELTSLLGYRNIAGFLWIKGDVYLQYNTITHFKWLIQFILPYILVIQFIIPGYLFIQIYQNRKQLFNLKFRRKFGYLVNEYKEQAWFWEFVKIIQRTFIITNLNLFADEIFIKATQIFLVIFIYLIFLYLFEPYTSKNLINLEIKSTRVQLCSIILAASYYQTQNQNNRISYFYLAILTMILLFQFILFLYEIFKEYLIKLKAFIENLLISKQKIGNFNLSPTLQNYILQKKQQQKKLKQRFAMLKHYLRNQTKIINEVKSRQDIYSSNRAIHYSQSDQVEQNINDIILTAKSDNQYKTRLNQ